MLRIIHKILFGRHIFQFDLILKKLQAEYTLVSYGVLFKKKH